MLAPCPVSSAGSRARSAARSPRRSRLGGRRLVFQPYSREQLKEIVLARLADAGAAGAFNPRAIEYAARKVPPAARAHAHPTLTLASSTRCARCRAPLARAPARPPTQLASWGNSVCAALPCFVRGTALVGRGAARCAARAVQPSGRAADSQTLRLGVRQPRPAKSLHLGASVRVPRAVKRGAPTRRPMRQVAAVSGDVRRVLELCRRGAEVAAEEAAAAAAAAAAPAGGSAPAPSGAPAAQRACRQRLEPAHVGGNGQAEQLHGCKWDVKRPAQTQPSTHQTLRWRRSLL